MELHREADKLANEVNHLQRILAADESDAALNLALSQAKRVRRSSTLLVRALGQRRDSYSQEAQANVRGSD